MRPEAAPAASDCVAKNDTRLTLQMIQAGVDAFRRWNPETEEPEALVVEIFLSMAECG